MTTIATDGKSMAGDGKRCHRGTITNLNAVKVRKLADGSIVGTSGDVAYGNDVVAWLNTWLNCGVGDPPEYTGDDGGFGALLLRPDGELQLIGQDCKLITIEPPFAVGSGMDFAIGAMCAGANPTEAVAIASGRDPHTGGEITTLTLPSKLAGRSLSD